MKSHSPYKMFIIKKYVRARSASEAIKLDRTIKPDDVWIDEDWRRNQSDRLADAIGFHYESPPEDDE